MASNVFLFWDRDGESLRGRFCKSLKPNFSINEPLNHFVLVLVFLGSFSASSIAFAADEVWKEGYYYETYQGFFSTLGSAINSHNPECAFGSQYQSTIYLVIYNNDGTTSACSGMTTVNEKSCGSSTESYCQQPSNCPASGDVVRVARVENGSYLEDGTFIPNSLSGDSTIVIGGTVSADGCGFARSTDPDFDTNRTTKVYSDSQLITWENVISTGEPLEPLEGQPQSIIKENLTLVEAEGSTDTLEDNSSTVISEPVVSSDPDGSSVVTEQTTVVDTKNSGTKIETSDSITSVTQSNGIIKNTITTTTTTTNPDGSKTVTTEDHTVYTQTPITNYTIDNSSNTISYNGSSGSSASQTTTTTDTYDSLGNQTGSTTSTQGTGDSDVAEDQQQQEFCEINPGNPDCKEYAGAPTDGLYTPGDSTFESVLGDFQTRLNDTPVIQSVSGFFSLNVSGSCQVWSVNAWVFSITFDQLCTSTFLSILPFISAVLLAAASFVGFRIAFM